MHGIFFALLIMIILGLLGMGALIAAAGNYPGYGAAAGGVATGVAVLVLAMLILRIYEHKMGLWPKDKNKE
jgi:hypothetical protein